MTGANHTEYGGAAKAGPDPHDLATIPVGPGGALLCFGCQTRGTCRFGLTTFRREANGSVIAELTCAQEHEGGPGVAHGGWTASVLDEVVGLACVLDRQKLSVTGELTVRYLRPVPLNRLLRIDARVQWVDGRRCGASGTLVLQTSGAVLATAQGVWIVRDRGHFAEHQQWLAQQDTAT